MNKDAAVAGDGRGFAAEGKMKEPTQQPKTEKGRALPRGNYNWFFFFFLVVVGFLHVDRNRWGSAPSLVFLFFCAIHHQPSSSSSLLLVPRSQMWSSVST